MYNRSMSGQASMLLVALGLLLLVFAGFPGNSLAQDAGALPLTFDRLTSDQGLASERVQTIAQDQQGFLWIGTWNGLFRYDGHTVRAYMHNPDDPNSLGGNIINKLHVDQSGDLWIGLTEAGIDRYDPDTGQFVHYTADPANPAEPFISRISALTEDAAGGIWAAAQSQGLYRIDSVTGQMQRFRHDPDDPQSIGSDSLLSLLIDRTGNLWVGTNRGLDRLDPATGQFTHYLSNPDDPDNLLEHLILSLAEDGTGDLWLGVYDAGLHRFNPQTGQLTRYLHDPDDPYSISNDNPYKVYVDRAGTLWVGTSAGGLNRFEPESGRFYSEQNDPTNPDSLPKGSVRDIFEDRAGSLWLAVDGSGVAAWHPAKTVFRHYAAHPEPDPNRDSISVDAVRAIHQDKNGIIWIGTASDGLNRLDPATGEFTYYRHDPDDPNSLTGNSLYAIYEDRAGALWVGAFSGLNRFDPATGQFTRYQHDPGDPSSLSDNFVHAITEDRQGNLWIGARTGLNRLDRASGQFTAYQHDPANANSLSNSEVSSLYPDEDGALWVGTSGGLNRFEPASGNWTRYVSDPADPNSISSNRVNAIYKDSNSFVWASTQDGLNRLDPATGQFTRYTRQDGLPADTVIGILEDDQGYLWLSTFYGLSRFDPRTATFKNFDHADGLNNIEFDFYAYHRTQTGELWFGGKRGIDIVDPNRIIENPNAPPVVITDLAINNQPVPIGSDSVLTQSITTVDGVTLSYLDRVISFEFAALNYVAPAKNQYRYMLEGFDEQWVATTSARPFATYTNLDPGEYVFRVIGANNDGLWNEAGTAIRLTITPPWWQTWWFYALSVAAVVGVFGFIYWSKASQLKAIKGAAAAVRESEEKYRVLFESFPLGITVADHNGNIVESNAIAAKLLGVSKSEHERRALDSHEWQIIQADGTPMLPEAFAGVIALREQRRVEDLEVGIVKAGGEITWLSVTAAPLPQYGVVISYADITQHKLAEARIHWQSILLDAVGQAVIATDLAGTVVYFNQAAEELYGWSKTEVVGQNIMAVNVPEISQAQATAIMAELTQGRTWSGEFMVQRRDGTVFPAAVSDAPVMNEAGQLVGIVGISADITERKQAELARLHALALLRESEDQLRTLINAMPDLVCFKDGQGRWLEANHADLELFNLLDVPYQGKTDSELAEFQDFYRAAFLTCVDSDAVTWRARTTTRSEETIPTPDGDNRVFDVIKVPLFTEEGARKGLVVLGRDITARRQAEDELSLHSEILEHMSEGVQLSRTSDNRITYVNPTFARMFGYELDELVGHHASILNAPGGPDAVATAAKIARTVNETGNWQGEIQNVRKDGSTFWCLATVTRFAHPQYGQIGISVHQDITRRKQIEAEHVRQERLAAVGQLAAGIAHDFNNLLMTIMTNASMLEIMPDTSETMKPKLARIVQQSERAAHLTRQILDFSRQSVLDLKPLDVKSYLNETLRFIERTIPETIQVGFTYAQEDYTISGDPTGLQQIITNLAVNARDAMRHGGTLRFDLSRIRIAPAGPRPCSDMVAGEWVRLAVSDTGTGIPPEVMPHIFEPFFTTKEVGQGTGLGLAQVYGIMKNHSGCIAVDSQVGQGVTFSLYFPALVSRAATPDEAAPPMPLGRGETILLVEDEQLVLEVTREILETLNYRVFTASNGAEALTVYRAHADQIALVLTDAVMPTLDGFGLATALQAAAPAVKVLLLSGYAGEPEIVQENHPNIAARLQKPLTALQLAQALQKHL